jgi:hypothetical protein
VKSLDTLALNLTFKSAGWIREVWLEDPKMEHTDLRNGKNLLICPSHLKAGAKVFHFYLSAGLRRNISLADRWRKLAIAECACGTVG